MTKTLDGIAPLVPPPREEDDVGVLRARIRQLEEERAETQALLTKLRCKEFEANLEKMVANGLKAATFKAATDGRILSSNEHAAVLCGPVFEQGGNLFSLIVDRLHHPCGIVNEESALREIPKSYGQQLREKFSASQQVTHLETRKRRPTDGFETDYSMMEQMIYESFEGPVRVLMAMTYVRDYNGHPWIQLTLVNLDAVNRDDLTGLWRRGTFDNVLARKVDERRRMHERRGFSTPLSLLMIDLDHFSKVNNTYGHPAGDAALKTIARRITRAAGRKTDMVFRYGGEEIAVLLDDDRSGAEVLARRILEGVREADVVVPYDGGKTSIKLTTSIGGTVFLDEEDTASRMVARADASLYLAKGKHGRWSLQRSRPRNRIVFDEQILP